MGRGGEKKRPSGDWKTAPHQGGKKGTAEAAERKEQKLDSQ